MRNILYCITLLASLPLYPQKLERITIKGGEGYRQSLIRQLYHYPSFSNGVINLKNGDTINASMNYHKGLDQIHLIAGTDTIAITKNYEIKNVVIGNDSFYHKGIFIRVIQTTTHFKLGVQEKIRAANKEENVPYQRTPAPGSSAESSSVIELNKYGNPDGKKDFALIKQTIFYIGDKYHRFTKLTRKNILYMFPGKVDQVNTYLQQNSVVLHDEEDVKELIVFLETLR